MAGFIAVLGKNVLKADCSNFDVMADFPGIIFGLDFILIVCCFVCFSLMALSCVFIKFDNSWFPLFKDSFSSFNFNTLLFRSSN